MGGNPRKGLMHGESGLSCAYKSARPEECRAFAPCGFAANESNNLLYDMKQVRPLYNEFSCFLKRRFPYKVQKISLNAGFTCPNRDGAAGYGGCTYCNNQAFNPEYCNAGKPIARQLEEGKTFFGRKYPEMRYLAYFQAYTNTYAGIDVLKRKYEEALGEDKVVGLVIATRPDCMPDGLLDYLEELNRHAFLLVEYGIESARDETLRRINRGHDFRAAADAVERTAARGIAVGGHVILGLPGETHDDLLRQAAVLSRLPLTTLKMHQLQVIRGTRMAHEYERHPEDFHLLELGRYVHLLVSYIQRLRPGLVLERFISQSPKELLLAPDWGLKNHEFNRLLQKRMEEAGACQGQLYDK